MTHDLGAIIMALFEGDVKPARDAFRSGMSPAERVVGDEWTLLHAISDGAYTHAPIECLQFLIDQGVPLDARDAAESTALHYAARSENASAVRLFLAVGCEVDPIDIDGMTPLHHAVRVHPYPKEVITMLLSAGADANHGSIRKLVEAQADPERDWLLAAFDEYK